VLGRQGNRREHEEGGLKRVGTVITKTQLNRRGQHSKKKEYSGNSRLDPKAGFWFLNAPGENSKKKTSTLPPTSQSLYGVPPLFSPPPTLPHLLGQLFLGHTPRSRAAPHPHPPIPPLPRPTPPRAQPTGARQLQPRPPRAPTSTPPYRPGNTPAHHKPPPPPPPPPTPQKHHLFLVQYGWRGWWVQRPSLRTSRWQNHQETRRQVAKKSISAHTNLRNQAQNTSDQVTRNGSLGVLRKNENLRFQGNKIMGGTKKSESEGTEIRTTTLKTVRPIIYGHLANSPWEGGVSEQQRETRMEFDLGGKDIRGARLEEDNQCTGQGNRKKTKGLQTPRPPGGRPRDANFFREKT